MIENLKKFSIDNIHLFEDDDDVDFASAEVWCLADGNNTHQNPISLDVLKRDAHTMLGKFLVAKYSNWENDVTTHTDDEQIVGYFPKESSIQYKEKDGKVFAVFEALISKLYATPIYQLFKSCNFRNVSAEFTCIEGEEDAYGNKPIEELNFHGCTILGLDYRPACSGAEMNITKFSADEADKYYSVHNLSQLEKLQKFSKERRKNMAEEKTYKVNTSKDAVSEGAWDGDKTKQDAIKAKNFETIAPKIFMRLEDGWKDKEVTKLDYPVMTLEGDTFVY